MCNYLISMRKYTKKKDLRVNFISRFLSEKFEMPVKLGFIGFTGIPYPAN